MKWFVAGTGVLIQQKNKLRSLSQLRHLPHPHTQSQDQIKGWEKGYNQNPGW